MPGDYEFTIKEAKEKAATPLGPPESLPGQFHKFVDTEQCDTMLKAAIDYFEFFITLNDMIKNHQVNRKEMVTLEAQRLALERSLAVSYQLVIMTQSNYRYRLADCEFFELVLRFMFRVVEVQLIAQTTRPDRLLQHEMNRVFRSNNFSPELHTQEWIDNIHKTTATQRKREFRRAGTTPETMRSIVASRSPLVASLVPSSSQHQQHSVRLTHHLRWQLPKKPLCSQPTQECVAGCCRLCSQSTRPFTCSPQLAPIEKNSTGSRHQLRATGSLTPAPGTPASLKFRPVSPLSSPMPPDCIQFEWSGMKLPATPNLVEPSTRSSTPAFPVNPGLINGARMPEEYHRSGVLTKGSWKSTSDCSWKQSCEMVAVLFEELGLSTHFNIERATSVAFFQMVYTATQGRSQKQYHHWSTALRAVRSLHYIVGKRWGEIRPVELFTMFILCICHCVDHPGVNEAFLATSVEEMSWLHKQPSFEASAAHRQNLFNRIFQLSHSTECDIFRAMKDRDIEELEKLLQVYSSFLDPRWIYRILPKLEVGEDPPNTKAINGLILHLCTCASHTFWDLATAQPEGRALQRELHMQPEKNDHPSFDCNNDMNHVVWLHRAVLPAVAFLFRRYGDGRKEMLENAAIYRARLEFTQTDPSGEMLQGEYASHDDWLDEFIGSAAAAVANLHFSKVNAYSTYRPTKSRGSERRSAPRLSRGVSRLTRVQSYVRTTQL